MKQQSLVLISLIINLWSLVNTKKPNIVFILADDYGWNDIGYHNDEIYTPTLDKLAESGVKLDNYYVQPICTPSRSQLLSGRYQIHTGLQHSIIHIAQPNGLPLELPTIADVVKTAGYSTHMVGKWHIGFYKQAYTPLSRGFDTFYGYLSGSENYYTHSRCFQKKMPRKLCGIDLRDGMQPDRDQRGHYSTTLFGDRAKKVIREHANWNKDKPMFLYLPFQAAHIPLQVPSAYLDRYQNIRHPMRRRYSAMVTCMDEAIANVTQQLKDSGMWDDTVIIFSSDNGGQPLHGASNYPLRGGKGTLWEGGIRSLGFVTGGRNINIRNRGTTNRDLMHITDWLPTIAHLAEADITDIPLDGYNVWNTISQDIVSYRKEILINIDPLVKLKSKRFTPRDTFDSRIRAAIRVGDWKLTTGHIDGYDLDAELEVNGTLQALEFRGDRKHIMLYNVIDDPNEMYECSDQHPEVVAKMLDRLEYYNRSAVKVRFPPLDMNADPFYHGGAWSPWM